MAVYFDKYSHSFTIMFKYINMFSTKSTGHPKPHVLNLRHVGQI